VALLPAIAELYSWKGSDNLTVPLTAAFWAHVIQSTVIGIDSYYNIAFVGVASLLIMRRRWLIPEALPAAIGLALVLTFATSWEWLCLLAVFFVAGSFSSKISGAKDSTSGRNAIQVFANGGVAMCCAIFYFFTQNPDWMMAFLVSVAVSLADTWSSDLGVMIGQQPRDIVTRLPVQKGMSGGVTPAGTGFGLAGASMIAVVASALFAITLSEALIVSILGTLGMFVDSLLGSMLQAKYSDRKGTFYEQHTEGLLLIKGYGRINNDAVNLLANAFVTASAMLYFSVMS